MNRFLMMASAATFALFAASAPAVAQDTGRSSPAVQYLQSTPADEQPDVLLDIPNLSVEEITLEVDNVDAQLSLDARVANLVRLNAGANVSIGNVNLTIKGVQASASLIVRLDNVRAIVERTLTVLENNPEIIETLGNTINQTVEATGGVVNNTVGTAGNLVGDLTQGILGEGQTLNDLAGTGLSIVRQTTNSAGNIVRRITSGDGKTYEVITDAAGKIVRSRQI